ncbi:MAG: PEP-CTERM sorting domain-containing protein [Planctomycetota bacterium]
MIKTYRFKQFALAGIAAGMSLPASAAIYTTSFDAPTFTAGAIEGQDGWVAQGQWEADGAGNITSTVGAFIRAHNTNVLGSTDIGENTTITSVLTLGAFSTPSNDIASFEQGILQQGLSHQQGVQAFNVGLAAGLFYNPGTGNVEFRQNQGLNETGTSSVVVGTASALGGTTYTMITSFTKTAADTWSVVASLDDGTNPVLNLSYTANGQIADLDTDSDGGGIIGGIQALPSAGGSGGVATAPFGPVSLSDFTIEVTPIPEPASLALIGLGVAAMLGRRQVR